MDRKSKQKIGYIFWVLVAVVMVMILFLGSMNQKGKVRKQQIQELVVIYPEIETQLQENFSYYQKQILSSELIFLTREAGAVLLRTGLTGREDADTFFFAFPWVGLGA